MGYKKTGTKNDSKRNSSSMEVRKKNGYKTSSPRK